MTRGAENGAAETASGPPLTSLARKKSHWITTLVLIFAFTLAARLLALISDYAINVFFMDQWDFNDATLFQKHSLWEMFCWQNGPHRQGMGAILSYLIEPHFQWNSRSESFLVGTIVIFSTICALWLKRRLFGAITLFDICIPLILLSPLQYETLFITANLAHGPLPSLMIILYCLAWTISNIPLRYSLILLINFVTIYTGFGIFLGVITPIALIADYWIKQRDLPRGAAFSSVAVVLSLASLASFFIHYTYQTAVDCKPNLFSSPWTYIQFLLLVFANLFGAKGTGLFPLLVGGIVLAAMLTALVLCLKNLRGKEKSLHPAAGISAILLGYCLLFAANAAYGRSCLGIDVAQMSRYVIYMGLGLLGLYFFLLTIPGLATQTAFLLILTASLIATIPIRQRDEKVMQFCRYAKLNWKACYISTEQIRPCNHAVGYGVYPQSTEELKAKLDFLKRTKQNLYSDLP
jgi:hypothetical protein